MRNVWVEKNFFYFGRGVYDGDGIGFLRCGNGKVEILGLRSGLFMVTEDFWINRYYLRVDLWKVERNIRGSVVGWMLDVNLSFL